MQAKYPRRSRLTRSEDFKRAFRSSIRSKNGAFSVVAVRNSRRYARFGMSVPARIVKAAVERNRLKRLARECFRDNQQILAGLDVVVVARPGSSTMSAASLRDSLSSHWQRVRAAANNKEPHCGH